MQFHYSTVAWQFKFEVKSFFSVKLSLLLKKILNSIETKSISNIFQVLSVRLWGEDRWPPSSSLVNIKTRSLLESHLWNSFLISSSNTSNIPFGMDILRESIIYNLLNVGIYIPLFTIVTILNQLLNAESFKEGMKPSEWH